MTRLRLLATGGTIASRSGKGGRTAQTSAPELLEQLAPLPSALEVETQDLQATLSFAMQLTDVQALALAVAAALDDGVDGVVVTHGTDSMEETAFLLDLFHDDPRPVILTGAQRPADSPAPDGPANLFAALQAAAAPAARNCGVLLLFDGVAWPARGVQKVDSLASAGFAAPGRGPVLRVTDSAVLPLAVPVRTASPLTDPTRPLPRVDVIPMYLGVDATAVRAALAAGAKGLVVAAFGAGNTPPAVTGVLEETVRSGIPVLICSRVAAGPVEAVYGGGGGADLRKAGALFGADLTPWQGRLLLATALAAGGEPEKVLADWLTKPQTT
jgi:L-asparaginase